MKAVDILLLDDGDGAVILPVVVDPLEWGFRCFAAQDKGEARIVKRGLVAVYGPWSWVCYPEVIESQREDGDERVGNGTDGGADDANRGEGYGGRGEEQVAS